MLAFLGRRKSFAFMLLALLVTSHVQSQVPADVRKKTILIDNDTFRYDSLSTIPGTLRVQFNGHVLVDSIHYEYFPFSSILVINAVLVDSMMGKFIEINYRTYGLDLEPEYSLRQPRAGPKTVDYGFQPISGDSYSGELRREGSLTRGISVGNNQNSSLNSDLNLQLSGKLNERFTVRAAISDRNIPLQPEGTTHQLQDFDRIFIEIEGRSEKISAGDQIFAPLPSRFIRYSRKVQGMSGQVRFKPNFAGLDTGTVAVGASLAKGRYHRQTLRSIEGNQGPYRLQGANGESFIVVLSGTEKVFIDGELLERGSDRDYIIDYNSAQITFTEKRIITANSRIIVEFEYSDRSYARAMMLGAVEMKGTKTQLRFQVYSESDLKSQNFQQPLGDVEKSLLASVGDSVMEAVLPRIDSVAFSGEEVLYKTIDTLVSGVTFSNVLVYSTSPDSAHFRASFSYVGPGKGNYVKTKSAANGKVYQWVAPVLGTPSGDYEPVSIIIAPKSQQAFSLGMNQKVGKRSIVNAELSVSRMDLNTFSSLDEGNDIGAASIIGVSHVAKFRNDTAKVLKTHASIEWTGENYSPIDRYLPAEFERDWNLQSPIINQNRFLATFNTNLTLGRAWVSDYKLEWLNLDPGYKGLRNNLATRFASDRMKGAYSGSLLTSLDGSTESSFYRHSAQVGTRIAKAWLTADHRFERNEIHEDDSLISGSAAFSEAIFKLALPDSLKRTGSVSFRYRNDLHSDGLSLYSYSNSKDVEFSLVERKSRRLMLEARAAYRDISYTDTTSTPNESFLISRISANSTLAKGNVRIRLTFETSTGSEVRKEYSYLKVADGQGVYAWNDYNNDSIKQLDEFEIAVFNDQANYIRIFIPTDDLISIVNSRLNADIDLRFPSDWRKAKGFKGFISSFSSDASFRFDTRRAGVQGAEKYNPYPGADPSSDVQAYNKFYQTRIYFNRGDPKFSAEANASNNEQRSLMANGFETSLVERYSLRLRTTPIQHWSMALEISQKRRSNTSEYFIRRNFNVLGPELEPSLSYQPTKLVRIMIYCKQANRKDLLSDITSKSLEFGSEAKYSFPGKGMAQARFSRTNLNFDGDASSPVGWEMLGGLVPGTNYVWNVGVQYSLKNNIQIGLNYEGRKPSSLKTIHTGMVQARYMF